MAKMTRQTKWLCSWKTWEDIPFSEAVAYLARYHYTLFHAYNQADGIRVMFFHRPNCATIYRLEMDLAHEA